MKNEDLYNGITEIDDSLIDRAAQTQKKRPGWRFWVPAAAAALAVCVGLAALWPRGGVSDPCIADEPAPPSQSQPVDSASVSPTPDRPTPSASVSSTPGQPTPSESAQVGPPETWDWGAPLTTPDPLPSLSDLPFAVSLAAYPELSEERPHRWHFTDSYSGGNEFFAEAMTQFLSGSEGENRVVSPLNLYLALAMVAETAGGNSRAQILDVLGVKDVEELRQQVYALWNGAYQYDEYAITVLANSLWMNQDLNYNQETTDTLAKSYYASTFQGEMGSKEYTQTLRDWVNRQTGGLLEEQAEGLELPPGAALSQVSTIYYQAMWYGKFGPEHNTSGTFHAPGGDVTCDFMHCSSLSGGYYRGEGFSAAGKWLTESGTMYFILPDEGTDMDTLLHSPALLKFLDGECEEERVQLNLTVPKFDVCSDLDLREGLAEMGVTDVFDQEADFSSLLENSEGTSISKVEHAARVSIDEEGCTGAAYTAVIYFGALIEELEPVDFILDRPFLFVLISDNRLPLFAGVVNVP